MSGLFVNKVLGALLASGLGFILINKFSNVVMHPDVPEPEKFAYSLAVDAPTDHAEIVPVAFPSPAWLDARDVTKGAKVFKKCKQCHTATAGGKDRTGPALWNIVGRPMASTAGFSYSDGMKTKGGIWGYEELDEFLTKPKNYITKTKMLSIGVKKEADRAALIEYLRLAADAPTAQLTVVVEAPEVDEDVTPEMGEEMSGQVVEDVVEQVAPVEGGH